MTKTRYLESAARWARWVRFAQTKGGRMVQQVEATLEQYELMIRGVLQAGHV